MFAGCPVSSESLDRRQWPGADCRGTVQLLVLPLVVRKGWSAVTRVRRETRESRGTGREPVIADSANPRVISTLRSQSSQASRHYKTLEMIQNIPSENFLKTLKKDSQAWSGSDHCQCWTCPVSLVPCLLVLTCDSLYSSHWAGDSLEVYRSVGEGRYWRKHFL